MNEEAMAQMGLLRQIQKKKKNNKMHKLVA
jgi:hypothetical protein